jgi:hypothetical protein
LYLDLLGHFPAGVYPLALECAEDAIEDAFFDPEPAFQGLNHLPMVGRDPGRCFIIISFV